MLKKKVKPAIFFTSHPNYIESQKAVLFGRQFVEGMLEYCGKELLIPEEDWRKGFFFISRFWFEPWMFEEDKQFEFEF